MIRRPPRSTQSRSSAASDVYKRQGADAAHPRLVEVGAEHELIRMEELLVALILLDPVALVGEALELVDGLFHGGGEVGTLALHHGQGDAVHEEHDVRD